MPPAPAPILCMPPRLPRWRRAPIWAPRAPVSLFAPTPLAGPDAEPAEKGGKADQPTKATSRDAELTKVTNDAVAYIRGLATLHGRNADWAEKAVREAVSLPYDAALEQHVIDLVAADIPDLLSRANGRSVIVQGRPVRLKPPDWRSPRWSPACATACSRCSPIPRSCTCCCWLGCRDCLRSVASRDLRTGRDRRYLCAGRRLRPQSAANRLCRAGAGAARPGADGRRGFVPSFGAFVLGGMSAFVIGSLLMFEVPGARLPLPVIAGATLASAALFGLLLALLLRARRRPVVSGTATLIGFAGPDAQRLDRPARGGDDAGRALARAGHGASATRPGDPCHRPRWPNPAGGTGLSAAHEETP